MIVGARVLMKELVMLLMLVLLTTTMNMERGGIAARVPFAAWLYEFLLPLKRLFDWLDFGRGFVVFGS